MLKILYGLLKIATYFILNKKINNEDYSDEYDNASKSYKIWQKRMGKHTEKIIELTLPIESDLNILDFACGNGFVTKKLLEKFPDHRLNIIGVDISKEMIKNCRSEITNNRVKFIAEDGIKFLLTQPEGSLDAIFCGWGMVYFKHKKLIPLMKKVLKKGGFIASIMNCKGTLAGIEDIYIETMLEYPEQINKIMDVRFYLPSGKDKFAEWFENYGFETIKVETGEEMASFDSPEELFKWLKSSGALAGCGKIFKNNEKMEKIIINKIEKKLKRDGKFSINHRFVYGFFRKK